MNVSNPISAVQFLVELARLDNPNHHRYAEGDFAVCIVAPSWRHPTCPGPYQWGRDSTFADMNRHDALLRSEQFAHVTVCYRGRTGLGIVEENIRLRRIASALQDGWYLHAQDGSSPASELDGAFRWVIAGSVTDLPCHQHHVDVCAQRIERMEVART